MEDNNILLIAQQIQSLKESIDTFQSKNDTNNTALRQDINRLSAETAALKEKIAEIENSKPENIIKVETVAAVQAATGEAINKLDNKLSEMTAAAENNIKKSTNNVTEINDKVHNYFSEIKKIIDKRPEAGISAIEMKSIIILVLIFAAIPSTIISFVCGWYWSNHSKAADYAATIYYNSVYGKAFNKYARPDERENFEKYVDQYINDHKKDYQRPENYWTYPEKNK